MLKYPEHIQNSLNFGHGPLIFLFFINIFDLMKLNKCCVYNYHFDNDCEE